MHILMANMFKKKMDIDRHGPGLDSNAKQLLTS
jgi:hypothetical protein